VTVLTFDHVMYCAYGQFYTSEKVKGAYSPSWVTHMVNSLDVI